MPLTIQVFIPASETEATLTAITGTGTAANPYTITQQGSSQFGTITVADDANLAGSWQWKVGTRAIGRVLIVAGQTDYPIQTNQQAAAAAIAAAVPANFASLGITGDGYISRVVLVDTCTANSDMRGTDNALLASSYTAPANADIAAIKAKTDNLPNDPATIAKQDEILGAIGDIDCGGGGGGDCGDATEAKQDAILAALTTADIRRVALPIQDGTLAIVQGDTYDDIAQPKARFATERDFTDGWTVVLTIRDKDDAVVYSVAGVVESDESIAIAIIAPTGLPMTGCPGVWEGKFDVEVRKGASVVTIERGPAFVYEDQTR
jgi:hypothetical protein